MNGQDEVDVFQDCCPIPREEVEKVDKRISELQEKYEQKLREAQWKAKDFPMMDKL